MVPRLSVDDGLRLLSYDANEDPVGTTDLEIFVLRFFALFVALLSAFLSALFAIFRNLLCLTMMRSIFAKHIFRSSVVICWAFHAQAPLIYSLLFGKIYDEQGEKGQTCAA